MGVIIGKRCKNVVGEEVGSVLFGYVPILDMTAKDILQRNPSFLARAKSFNTFFSFGPIILTPDEIKDAETSPLAPYSMARSRRRKRFAA